MCSGGDGYTSIENISDGELRGIGAPSKDIPVLDENGNQLSYFDDFNNQVFQSNPNENYDSQLEQYNAAQAELQRRQQINDQLSAQAAEREAAIAESQGQAEAIKQQLDAVAAQQAKDAADFETARSAEEKRVRQEAKDQEAFYAERAANQARQIAQQQAAQAAEIATQKLNTNAASQSIRILGAKQAQTKAPVATVTRGKKSLGVGGVATISPTQSLRIGSTANTAGVGTNLGV
jgi:hypothetical protein